jgi:hypothetical protein
MMNARHRQARAPLIAILAIIDILAVAWAICAAI